MTRLNAARAFPVGLAVLLLLVVLIRAPSDASRSMSAADGEATEAPAGMEAVNGDSSERAPSGTIAPTRPETVGPPFEPPVEPSVEPSVEPCTRTGCFRSGSTRAEVRAAMGAADTVVAGAWEYGQSWVTFGYGTVLEYSNEGGNLRLCE